MSETQRTDAVGSNGGYYRSKELGWYIPIEFCRTLEKEGDAKDALIEELREALSELLKRAPSGSCENFHHEKTDRHSFGKQCPPLSRYEVAMQAAFLLLAKLPPVKREGKA